MSSSAATSDVPERRRTRDALTALRRSARDRRWSGVRAAAGIGLPLVIGAATGHVTEGGQAALGSFVAVYAADAPYRRRAWLLASVGVLLAVATALGTVVAGSVVATCAVGAAFAAVCALGAQAVRLGPPREYFFVLTFLLATTLPVDASAWASRGGLVLAGGAVGWLVAMAPWALRRPGPERAAVLRADAAVARLLESVGGPAAPGAGHDAIVAVRQALEATDGASGPAGIAWSRRALAAELALEATLALEVEEAAPLDPGWAATMRDPGATGDVASRADLPPAPDAPAGPRLRDAVGRVVAAWTTDDPEAPGELDPRWRTPLRWSLRPGSPHRRVAARMGLAVLIGLVVGHALGLDHPSWVAVSAAAVLQGSSLAVARTRGVHRAIGTAIGVVVAGAIFALEPSDGVKIAVIVVLQFGIELVIVASYGLAVSAITPLVLLLISVSGAGRTVETLLDVRLVDTLVGCAIAGVLLLLTRPRTGTGPLAGAQAEAVRAAAAVIVPAVAPGATRGDLLGGRRRAHDAIVRLRAAEDDAIGDAIRRDPREDARWPVSATVDRLARLALTIPTGDEAPLRDRPDAADAERLRDGLETLAVQLAGGPAVDPGPLPALPGLPRTTWTVEQLRRQLVELGTPRPRATR